jgi:hypothetical protein
MQEIEEEGYAGFKYIFHFKKNRFFKNQVNGNGAVSMMGGIVHVTVCIL